VSHFVQLTAEDCNYLLDLIQDMDSDTAYTARQRSFTVPKLQKIIKTPDQLHLNFLDVDYLLELIEDDDLPEVEQQREMTRQTLEQIQELQQARFEETRSREQQRKTRRAKRAPRPALDALQVKALNDHFNGVKWTPANEAQAEGRLRRSEFLNDPLNTLGSKK
jgi:hypothetical protein